jgi:hypothetical protein
MYHGPFTTSSVLRVFGQTCDKGVSWNLRPRHRSRQFDCIEHHDNRTLYLETHKLLFPFPTVILLRCCVLCSSVSGDLPQLTVLICPFSSAEIHRCSAEVWDAMKTMQQNHPWSLNWSMSKCNIHQTINAAKEKNFFKGTYLYIVYATSATVDDS